MGQRSQDRQTHVRALVFQYKLLLKQCLRMGEIRIGLEIPTANLNRLEEKRLQYILLNIR